MKIKNITEIELTPEEIKEILLKHFTLEGYVSKNDDTIDVVFNVVSGDGYFNGATFIAQALKM
jgi:hypothetical protein